MNFYEGLILNIIFLLFPFLFYIIFISYKENFKIKNSPFILDIVNISVVYLITLFSRYFNNLSFLLLINIPLIISFSKNRKYASIFIALFISIFYIEIYNLPKYLIIGEYITYIILFFTIFKSNKYENVLKKFTFLKGIVLSIEIFYLLPNDTSLIMMIIETFLMLVIFYLIGILINKLILKGEQIISFNSMIKDLEKDKMLKNALFKITHEIKNPIAVCKGYLSMMNYNDFEKVKKYNNVIKGEINRTLDILDDFKDYTKINISPDVMDVNLLLEDTIFIMMPLFEEKNIKINILLSNDELIINGDYNRLKQVLVNVFKNSVEAIDRGGVIKVVSSGKNKDNIEIKISDNGCGMDRDSLLKVGELFYTTKVKGTGLGVSLSKEIIKAHFGNMKYKSKKGVGTDVIITIPKYN